MKKQYAILHVSPENGYDFSLYMDDDKPMLFDCAVKAHRYKEELKEKFGDYYRVINAY